MTSKPEVAWQGHDSLRGAWVASVAGTTGQKEHQRRKVANAGWYLKDYMLSVSEKPLREALETGLEFLGWR